MDTKLSQVLDNIDRARRLSYNSDSVKIVTVVSGTECDKDTWQERLKKISPHIFNRDGSTFVLSLQEKIEDKFVEGNFLGTLLAYRYIKEAVNKNNIQYRECVILIGMLFGKGERMSPITQAKGCRKPGIEVTPANIDINGKKKALTAIEEALFYFTPVAKYLERKGFRGVLNKWGDETQVASIDLGDEKKKDDFFSEYDVIKIISVLEVTEELAKQKDWVVVNEEGDMAAQISRNNKDVVIEQLEQLGIKKQENGGFYAGVSLGPVAVSYNVLDIASDIFSEEILTKGIHIDFDPYFLMALAMKENELDEWRIKTSSDKGLQALNGMVPDFFGKVQQIKKVFQKKYNRKLNLKTIDLGADVYWADIGQHSAMRDKFLAFNDNGPKGIIARRISDVPDERDAESNIIVNSEINPDVTISNSVIINSKITGSGQITESVIIDSELAGVDMKKAFAVRSLRLGKTKLAENSGIYDSLGREDLELDKGMRHVSILSEEGKFDLKVSEDTDLRDKENTYNISIFNNAISFKEAFNKMCYVDMEELEKRRIRAEDDLRKTTERQKK